MILKDLYVETLATEKGYINASISLSSNCVKKYL